VETPYRSLRGQQAAKPAHGGAGVGCRKKRMPFCNRTDTGFKVTRRESEPTSDRWYVARKLGEPLMWGKANGRCFTGVCTSNIVERHVQRLWVGIAKVARGLVVVVAAELLTLDYNKSSLRGPQSRKLSALPGDSYWRRGDNPFSPLDSEGDVPADGSRAWPCFLCGEDWLYW